MEGIGGRMGRWEEPEKGEIVGGDGGGIEV